jgi:hypothetical protein
VVFGSRVRTRLGGSVAFTVSVLVMGSPKLRPGSTVLHSPRLGMDDLKRAWYDCATMMNTSEMIRSTAKSREMAPWRRQRLCHGTSRF